MKRTRGEKIFSVFNYIFLTCLALITVYPFWDVIRVSISTSAEVSTTGFRLFPSAISWEGYQGVLSNSFIWLGYRNTFIRIILGVAIRMTVTVLLAYPLSKRYLPMRTGFTMFIVFTMFFSGGLIPSYLNIRSLGLDNTIWALVLPMAVDTFAMLIMRNFFMGIPNELEESARIDGASTTRTLISIILPLSMPILMTVGLWAIVEHWNAWFDCLIYIRDPKNFVLQVVLRKIIIDASPEFDIANSARIGENVETNVEIIKSATIIVSTIPIMIFYPFVQKYFVKGVMVGSLKG